MQKIVGYTTVYLYLIFFIGFSVSFHFCHGELSEISVVWQENSCGCEGKGNMVCCQDVDKYYRLVTDHVVNKQDECITPPQAPSSPFEHPALVSLEQITLPEFPDTGHDRPHVPIYIAFQSLILYG